MDQWSTAMNCSSYPPDPDGFIEVDGPPGSASYCDESSYDNMMASVVTEKPNCDQQLVGTRRSSLSQDALSNQLSATESSRRPSIPSISGITGQTSLDYDFMHNSDFIGGGIAQPVPRSDLDHSASYLYDLNGTFSDENNPPRPDVIGLEDLAEVPPASQLPAINVQPPQQPTYPAIMGLPGRYNSESLPQLLNSVNRECQLRGNQGESGLSQPCLFEIQRIVGDLTVTVNSLIHDQRPSAPSVPNVPGSTGSSAGQTKKDKNLQCPLPNECDASFGSMGALKRHVAEQHHPQYEFHCPVQGCQFTRTRKHKVKEHITNFHRLMVPRDGQTITQPHITDQQIEANKHELPVPSKCSLCPQPVNSWGQFYNCLMSHNGCSSAKCPSTSRRGSADHGGMRGGNGLAENHLGAHGPGVGMPAATPTNTGIGINLAPGPSSSFSGINMDQSNPHLTSAPMTPSLSDGMLGDTANPSASLDGSTQHGTPNGRGTNYGNHTRSTMGPPRPQSSRSSSHQNVRPSRQRCPICGAFMQSIIRSRRPINTCGCGYTSLIRIPVRRLRGHLSQDINPQFPTRQSPPQTQIRQQTQGGPVMGNEFQQMPQFQQPPWQGGPSQPMNDFIGPPPSSPGGTQYHSFAVWDTDEPGLSEVEMDHQFRETKENQPFGSWMSCLPMGIPRGRDVIKPLKQMSKFIQDCPIMPPHISVFTPPVQGSSTPSQCNCPCRTAAILKEAYEAHAELAPGKQVKLGLKILSPEEHGTGKPQQHLRSRVQLVVKLLKLRASAAKSSDKKQTKGKRAVLEKALKSTFDGASQLVAEEADDTEASDTDSVFSENIESMSSSLSDMTLQTPSRPISPSPDESCTDAQEYEETIELSVDLDLDSTLSTISQWSGVLSGELCSDIASMDPARVLGYFLKYIMCVMMALSHANDDGHGSRLQ